MHPDKTIAITVGVLFIIATAAGVLSAILVSPIIAGSDFLEKISASTDSLLISGFSNLVMAICVVAIAVVIFPVLKRANLTLAIGFITVRVIEGVLIIIGTLAMLSLAQISTDYVQVAPGENAAISALGTLMLGMMAQAFAIGTKIIFSLSALILYYLLFTSKLLPRFLTIWGFAGGVLLLVSGVLDVSGVKIEGLEPILVAPIALNEMVMAVWLIIRGFSTPTPT